MAEEWIYKYLKYSVCCMSWIPRDYNTTGLLTINLLHGSLAYDISGLYEEYQSAFRDSARCIADKIADSVM